MKPPAVKALLLVALGAASTGFLVGCGRHSATDADCLAILHRVVELELTESGFRDPVVRDRWKDHIGRKLSPDLGHCRGRRIPDDLDACLHRARTPEDIAHGCLR